MANNHNRKSVNKNKEIKKKVKLLSRNLSL